jgi:N-acyl-D-amino-acid deacylase
LIEDGLSQSDIRQGVTLEVFGEGRSMGPLNEKMKQDMVKRQGEIKYNIVWTTLGQYLEYLEEKGISTNIASFIGATTVRIHTIGYEDRAATSEELGQMKELVRSAMEEGALGLGSSLIYVPATFADTQELIELSKIVAEYGGLYISHIRNEGDYLLQALDELLQITHEANVRAEIYHLKASGQNNWHKLDRVFSKVDSARARGLYITANMYTYPASSTGLNILLPAWVKEGGHDSTMARLRNLKLRTKIISEMDYAGAGSPDRILLVGFRNKNLRHLIGKTLVEIADIRAKTPKETAIDLMIEDDSRIGTIYFSMSEENIRKKVSQPWISFCSDAASMASQGVFLNSNPHPRAYGSFARLLGKYVREKQIISLEEAIRRLTSFPAANLKIKERGLLKTGYFADIVVFNPATISDLATFENPHQYATGVEHVLVNGIQVIKNGHHTTATPGRFVRGPGWQPPN